MAPHAERPRSAHEPPPTAGLPLRAADLLPGGDAALDTALVRFLGVESVQLECSGTAALVVALTALRDLTPARREVVVPAYTCPLVALAVARCGLALRVCELLPEGFDMDPVALAALCGPMTLAVVPTHLGGRVGDAAPARACARAVGAWTIEDAAQALGARIGTEGRSVGSDSDIAFFSLAVGKGLTIFEGGALVARDPALRAALQAASARLVPSCPGWELRRSIELLGYAALYRPAGLRWAYGRPLRQALAREDWVAAAGDDFEADIPLHRVGRWRRAVGVRALERLPAFLEQTRRQAAARIARLRQLPGITVLDDSAAVPGARGTWPVLLVLLPDQARRDALVRRLWGAGCGVSLPFVQVLPDYVRYADVVPAVRPGALPHARATAGRLLAISNSPWLDDARFDHLCDALARGA
ncbi:DegT/DnrJ/EryC1/StrS family aminotransferase [uncultured Xylophilus sp.]|uniref:DegT/DnrJ/EryC1/StrS family aminotransferase n=1 Tax=uncultured Xylophilus sp. TaxID=296832 RepID=UPI0025D64109|nr:DegT/DnrJ/EryC1/StrS family aminotransferase [uncultured Xylophilus sp.]